MLVLEGSFSNPIRQCTSSTPRIGLGKIDPKIAFFSCNIGGDVLTSLPKIGESTMSRRCEVTKKRFGKGKTYNYRGIAKAKGGIGLNITGSAKRQHRINLTEQKIWSPEQKRFIKMKLSAHGLRIIDRIGVDEFFRREKRKAAEQAKVKAAAKSK